MPHTPFKKSRPRDRTRKIAEPPKKGSRPAPNVPGSARKIMGAGRRTKSR